MTANLSNFLSVAPAAATAASPVDAILDAVRHHLGMEIAFAARYVGDRREFTHIRTDLPLPHKPGMSEPKEESFCWHILEGRLPELIPNAADLPFAQTLPITSMLPVGCHMDVPLRLKDGTVYGSFCALSRSPDYTLNARDLDTLRAFAELAAVQIEAEVDAERERAAKLLKFEDAMAQGWPAIVYQPIHRLDGGAIVGVEALSRFPDQDERPPCRWFNEAAGLGLSEALELAAIRSALVGLPFLGPDVYLSVNVAPATAMSEAFAALVDTAPPGRLVVEVTEHAAVEDFTALGAALQRLRRHARIAIDDVGAGYANLRHMLDLKPDIIKLDMSLTRDVDRDPARRALIGAMVRFCEEMGSVLVAEGVERDGERLALLGLGIDIGQGWHFSRAMPLVAVQQMLLGQQTGAAVERRRWRGRVPGAAVRGG